MRRLYAGGIASGLAAAVVLAHPAAASAKPLEHEHFHDEVHETILECGLTLQHDLVVDGHFLFVPHGRDRLAYAGEQVRGTETFTLPNGHTFDIKFATASRDLRVTDNGDGTLTILAQGAGNFVVSGSHSSVVLRDPGMTRVSFVVDHAGTPTDPSDDEEIEGSFQVVKGSTGRNDTGEFCEDLLLIAG
jgi:hypothetical protein